MNIECVTDQNGKIANDLQPRLEELFGSLGDGKGVGCKGKTIWKESHINLRLGKGENTRET